MNIDRARFLLCAGAIAGSGCVINDSDEDTETTAPSTTNAPTSSTTANETDEPLTGSTTVDGSESGSESGSGSVSTGSGSVSTGSGSTDTGTSGGVCDDSVGADIDCAPALATDCGQFAVDACNGAKAAFKPRVAEDAANCIVGLGPADDCLAVYACMNEAMAGACADDTADVTCETIIASCEATTPTTAEECHGFLDGMNEAGRAEMIACTVDDGCRFGIYSCTEGIGI